MWRSDHVKRLMAEGLSSRVAQMLENRGLQTLEEVVQLYDVELLREPNFGKKSLKEVEDELAKRGLRMCYRGFQEEMDDSVKADLTMISGCMRALVAYGAGKYAACESELTFLIAMIGALRGKAKVVAEVVQEPDPIPPGTAIEPIQYPL